MGVRFDDTVTALTAIADSPSSSMRFSCPSAWRGVGSESSEIAFFFILFAVMSSEQPEYPI